MSHFYYCFQGLFFRARFKLAERTSLDFSPFGRVAADAILWAIFAHLLWLLLSFFMFSQRFEPAVLLKLLSSAPAYWMTSFSIQMGILIA
ncbi:hypothetical protein CR105_17835 [Massilia eurypsychrophila]|uniref:Uncharacterized protein n=1 Tax=Massilia eurypsychrophila TaxID=1485217 RepID=A0A2G8TC70_9BURK|nr:hypothetical protein CR105_17835 [Massilia eurypsychrophila]